MKEPCICGIKQKSFMPYSLPSDTRYILYEETDRGQLKQKPCHFKCGIYLICTHGQALISTGVQQ